MTGAAIHRAERIESVAQTIERRVCERPIQGALDPDTVAALDIVTHALTFTKTRNALLLWRAAVWERRFPSETRVAVHNMLEYLIAEYDQGDPSAAAQICNCLHAVLGVDENQTNYPPQL
jgi:hypothetical protein